MKIAVIQFKQIGDVLITSSMFKNIKKLYPDSQVDYIIYDYTAGIVEDNPYIDNIILINKKERKNPLSLYKKFLKISKKDYDYTIDIIGDVRSAILTRIINSKNKIVSKNKKRRNKWFYNIRVENPKKNVCDYRNYTLEGIEKGNFEKIKEQTSVEIFLKEEDVLRLKKRMSEKKIDLKKPVAVFGINSRREYKKWDLEYFILLINHLIDKTDMQIIFYSNQEEREYAELAKSKIKKQGNVFTDIYTKNIKELAALFKNCDIFVGNEGGPRHIAEAVGIPTFSIAYITHNREDWILNRNTWGKYNKMLQIDDYLDLSEDEFLEYKNMIKRDRKKEIKEFKKLKPEFVIKEIDLMISELRKNKDFRSDIEWLD